MEETRLVSSPKIQAAKLWQPSSNASLVPTLSVCCLRYLKTSRIRPCGLCQKLALSLSLREGSQMQIKRSGWHQNWQVRNICALPASRQIGRLGDGMDYPWCAWGFGEPSWNKQFPPFCDGWMRIQWLYWLDGVSQTTEQKEKHGQEKQSHLTSEERLLLKFRSQYTLPQVCHSSLVMSSDYQRTIHI